MIKDQKAQALEALKNFKSEKGCSKHSVPLAYIPSYLKSFLIP